MSRRCSPISRATSISRRDVPFPASSWAAARRRCSASTRSRRCWKASPRGCRSCRTPRSRWKRTPGRSSTGASRVTPRPASIACRSARSPSTRRRSRSLGRIHGPAEIGVAVAELASAGLHNFNLDLMYALPQQTREGALADLEAAIALGPAHLSHYQLTLEPGTAFLPPPARAPGRRRVARHAVRLPGAPRGGGLCAVRDLRLRAAGPAVPAQPQLLALRRLSRHRRRRARQGDGGRPGRAHREAALAARVPARRRAGRQPAARRPAPGSCRSSSC